MPAGGRSPSPGTSGAAAAFGDSHYRWQIQVPGLADYGDDVQFSNGLLLVAETDGTMYRVTAYHEATGTSAWSRVFPQEPVVAGSDLLVTTSSASETAYRSGSASAGCSWNMITRIDPTTGANMWTAKVPQTPLQGCSVPTASSAYVVVGTWILNASTGVTLQQLPAEMTGAAFGNDILAWDGSTLQLDTLANGDLQAKWRRDITGYALGGFSYPQIMLLNAPEATSSGPYRIEIVDPATGAISGTITTKYPFLTPLGATGASTSGHLFLLSPAGLRTGPTANGKVTLIGGLLWQSSQSLNSQATGPVNITAIDPTSFKTLGSLVIEPSEVTPNSQSAEYLVSDGQYAAFVGGAAIYVYKL